ncbi:MAG TPA: cation:proton antiporter [Thermoplasmata archaeon]|nr:cation:proton antiporter [Thermoplasmata archaeon]
MADTTTFFIDLFILLAAAVVAGEAARRLGQAALVGQLLVGVILGPSLLGPFDGLSTLTPQLGALQFLATVFILFMAGLDVVPGQIYRMGASTIMMGVAIFAVPFALISVVAKIFYPGPDALFPLFLGLTLSITALPVMGIMLIEFGILKTTLGNLLINTALVNELAAVTVFAVLLQLFSGTGTATLAVVVAALSVGVFLGAMLSIHSLLTVLSQNRWWVATRQQLAGRWRSKEAGFAILMVGLIGASLFSQYMGLTFVVGAFYAGILVTKESAGTEHHRTISGVFEAMTWGFFIPLFFAFVGVQMNLRLLGSVEGLTIFGALLATAVVAKLGTGFSVARFFGWPRSDALAIGHLVSSRGAVELAMAVILLSDGVFTTRVFTIVAGVGLVTTIIAPIAATSVWESAARDRKQYHVRISRRRDEALASARPLESSLSFGILEDESGSIYVGTDVRPPKGAPPRPSDPDPGAAEPEDEPSEPGPPPLPTRRPP